MGELSSKPYLIRAIHEWCTDAGFTPYLSVRVDENTRVPRECVKQGEIVLNISHTATRNLTLGNDLVQFSARFNGVSREVSVPVDAVVGIFARENGQGLFFEAKPHSDAQVPAQSAPVPEPASPGPPDRSGKPPGGPKPRLKVVK